jgi:small subunit ribosomal protein S5
MRRGPDWQPKTRLGKMVFSGEISTMREALDTGLPLKEPEIVDILLPGLGDEVLDVNMVQRMTDSGRRVNFVIVAVVGNEDGYVGLGRTKGKEVGPDPGNAGVEERTPFRSKSRARADLLRSF